MSEKKNIISCRDCEISSLCFQSLFPDELEFLNEKKIQLTYLKGENIFKQGAFTPYVMHVVEGIILIYLQTGFDKQVNIRLAKTGDFLAFSSVFGVNIYACSAIALKNSRICMIDKGALKQLLLKNPDFAMRITSENYRNEALLLEIIKNVVFKQMRGKLATALIYLFSNEFSHEDIFHYLTRQDIADFASISTESAIKFLKEFEKEGILKLKGKEIKIVDKDKLEEIARRG
ncbi:MAG TPA: Crp/Fnr family transcriptional regulator [Bacteroidales bacterium]|nr:Crp/Fnr family transcriptional regulator [Bacteroidales bacterium]